MSDDAASRCDEVLTSLRRITRAIDLHSRATVNAHGLSTPQLLLLRALAKEHPVSVGRLAKGINLSHATVTVILDRLAARGLVQRDKDTVDKRRVLISPTPHGLSILAGAPPLLQDRFIQAFLQLPMEGQDAILDSLRRVAAMMEAKELDAAPMLTAGGITDQTDPPIDQPDATPAL